LGIFDLPQAGMTLRQASSLGRRAFLGQLSGCLPYFL
jgi:hypothetical protein